ncbi:hypothetical protein TbgDal_IX1950 [Trypanosoma brucei gambiense DAL972]|uniref:Uncharacterized protein n=1 Tax=Trypanosoma brucei gambiense (strain MHOM/CI/86/DAL972) TaxID=679716 RepID=C9ZXH6_TRYB9|nr:hypothetical protein TbgDal_IX1950 [Trypanosoma brucei gambiense DAL972]CBH14120.1 hypothetical protein TbgDal_IX1950 [Trypanosoma brucei gambiense DAL972]|eukprot:XP_011776391.1 hypothetical protein TbgDal_IX1950 [Trypanosoma brucei gambiense DAL972]
MFRTWRGRGSLANSCSTVSLPLELRPWKVIEIFPKCKRTPSRPSIFRDPPSPFTVLERDPLIIINTLLRELWRLSAKMRAQEGEHWAAVRIYQPCRDAEWRVRRTFGHRLQYAHAERGVDSGYCGLRETPVIFLGGTCRCAPVLDRRNATPKKTRGSGDSRGRDSVVAFPCWRYLLTLWMFGTRNKPTSDSTTPQV